jgi:phosphoribosyl-ATP pyrophosphohydrolase/phosphoribosyl-AMP cyclohydrolase
MSEIGFLGVLERIIDERLAEAGRSTPGESAPGSGLGESAPGSRPAESSAAPSSYTARLASQGVTKVAQKVGEEGVETALAAAVEPAERVTEEAADLIYHLLVLLRLRGLGLADVAAELERRHTAPRQTPPAP